MNDNCRRGCRARWHTAKCISLILLFAKMTLGCSPAEMADSIKSQQPMPAYVQTLCDKDAGYHVFQTARRVPGFFVEVKGAPFDGCDVGCLGALLKEGFGYVELRVHERRTRGVRRDIGPGLYRVTLAPETDPHCIHFTKAFSSNPGLLYTPEQLKQMCFAYQPISQVRSGYMLYVDYFAGHDVLDPQQVTKMYVEVRDLRTGQILGQASRYIYTGATTQSGIHTIIAPQHKCPREEITPEILLRATLKAGG